MWEDSYGFPAFHSLIFNIVSKDFVTRYQTKVSKPVHGYVLRRVKTKSNSV